MSKKSKIGKEVNYPITDISILGPWRGITLGLQHVFTLFASTVLVPILT